jgi:hypothetical protein
MGYSDRSVDARRIAIYATAKTRAKVMAATYEKRGI